MSEGSQADAAGETLDSWKAIAAYLHRDVRTVLRWERDRGLPVHRIPGGGRAGVFAIVHEMEAWKKTCNQPPAPRHASPSIAVLPFANLCSDKENEYFGDGLADEIITLLTRIPG